MVEAEDQSFATNVANMVTMPENVPNLSQYVLTINLMNILLKISLIYREGFKKRDRN